MNGCLPDRQEFASNRTLVENGAASDLSFTPTTTLRPTSTPIPTLAPTATVIPIPTLALDNNLEAIDYLFETNYGCEFPCWWGIVPGETKWLAVEEFLGPFTIEIEQDIEGWYLDDGSVEHRVVLEVPRRYDADGRGRITVIEDWWGVVSSISVATNFDEMGLGIRDFLSMYGPPAEVYIYSSGGGPEAYQAGRVFTIGLFYENEGILMAYFGVTEEVGDVMELCISELVDEFAWLELWNPEDPIEFEKAATPGLNGGGELVFHPLGDVSGLDAESIFERIANGRGRGYCFEVEMPDSQE